MEPIDHGAVRTMDPRVLELQRVAAARSDVIGLMGALPAPEVIPRCEIAHALADVLASRDDGLQYDWPEGRSDLRAWIAQRLTARGAAVDPERVIITAGAQQALAIAAAVLPAASVAVGDATYAGALDAFARVGSRAVVAGGDARYIIAGVSNPHGVAMEDREALLATSRPVIVDEAYVELRFDGGVPRPLLADADGRVWHVGTISKTLAPGLRLGWLVPPRAHHAAALQCKQAWDLQSSSLCQAGLARLLAIVDYDECVARARACYADRATTLATALRRWLPCASFRDPEGGLSVWVETDDEIADVDFLHAALAEGVMVDGGSLFRPSASPRLAFRVSFSSASPTMLDEGARRLARALARCQSALRFGFGAHGCV
jgi:2-aminoadipate transaminase